MLKQIIYTCAFITLLIFSSFRMQNKKTVRYLPLGDSYTIGTGTTEKESWPYLLTNHLNDNGLACQLLDNPARNGFTTQNLIDHELPLLTKLKPDFVTLLIGVNDWVRNVPEVTFNDNLVYILDEIQKALPDKNKVILVTIPDFGVTPQGKQYSNGRNISRGITGFNAIIKAEAKKRNLRVVDVFELSQRMASDASLIAADGLHPSGKEYAEWEKLLLPEALRLLK